MSVLSSRYPALTLARQSQRYQEVVFRFIHRAPQVFHEETQNRHPHLEHDGDEGHASFDSVFASNHIPTSLFQRTLLSIGSAGISIADPSRGDMIATLGETTGSCALQMMLQTMENDDEGRTILRERPRLSSKSLDLSKLQSMPKGTLGKAYSNFLSINNVTPDSRSTVQFVDDVELAYVMQRYREMHDLIHTILQMRTNMLGEVTVKWVEAIQTKLPMCVGGALFGSIRLSKKQRQKYITDYLPWAIKTGWESKFLLNVYFEKRWDQTLEELQKEMNIVPLQIEKETYI